MGTMKERIGAKGDGSLAALLREVEERYVAANPKSHAQHAEACRCLSGGSTRTVLFYSPFPVVIARGEGARLWDLDGHSYADFLGEYSAGLYGHSHPVILAAVKSALEDGIVPGGPNPTESLLAQAICDRFPLAIWSGFATRGPKQT